LQKSLVIERPRGLSLVTDYWTGLSLEILKMMVKDLETVKMMDSGSPRD
jgi:hypothetical protein